MTMPAVIVGREDRRELRVIGLSPLDRLVVAAHRAGCAPITLIADRRPSLPRADGLAIPLEVQAEPPSIAAPVLLAEEGALATKKDLARLIREGARLSLEGRPLPIGVADRLLDEVTDSLAEGAAIEAEGFAALIPDAEAAKAAEGALWRSLSSSADGVIDRFVNRPLGRALSRFLATTSVTPNMVTAAATAIGLAGAALLARGEQAASIVGALLFQLSAVVDCVDGELARARLLESELGRWLDISADQVVHIAIFLAVALGLARSGDPGSAYLIGGVAALGVVLGFAVVVRGLLLPEERRGKGLQKMIDAVATRDFSVVLLAAAATGTLELFLWLTAIGSHVFWLLALVVQAIEARRTGAPT